MFDDITAGWEDPDTVDEYEDLCAGHGSKLLIQLAEESSKAMANAGSYGESIDKQIDDAFADGIDAPTVASFKLQGPQIQS